MITDLIKTQSFYTFISNKNRLINTVTMSCSTEYTYSKGDAVFTHTQDQIIEKPALRNLAFPLGEWLPLLFLHSQIAFAVFSLDKEEFELQLSFFPFCTFLMVHSVVDRLVDYVMHDYWAKVVETFYCLSTSLSSLSHAFQWSPGFSTGVHLK